MQWFNLPVKKKVELEKNNTDESNDTDWGGRYL